MTRYLTHKLAAAAFFGAAVLTATTAPQAIADSAPTTDGPSVLVMTVTDSTADTPGAIRTAILECGTQTGGDHPAPAAACGTLEADSLDFTAPPALQIMCPDIVQPVTVTATGLWSGTPVDYQQTYLNTCLMLRATGRLFDF